MSDKKLKISFKNLEKAVKRLEEMVLEPVDAKRAQVDATIQRFEFCFELFWKSLKLLLESRGQEARFPRDVLQISYTNKLIDHEKMWLDMMEDRNRSSHVYDQDEADEIYEHIKTYLPEMQKTFLGLKEKYKTVFD